MKDRAANSDSDDDAPLKPKERTSSMTPVVDKEKEAIDMARERNWEAVKRKHEEANKKEEAATAVGECKYFLVRKWNSRH